MPPKHEHKNTEVRHLLESATALLPHQAILENFIHHNPLKQFESMKWKDALEYIQQLESYMSPAERAFSLLRVDPRKRVNEALAEISSAFLDRGAAKWAPHRDKGFLYFFASLEGLGFAPWRSYARKCAKRILDHYEKHGYANLQSVGESILKENLAAFGVPEEEWHLCIQSMLLELRGWAGMFHRMETHPTEAPANAVVQLLDFCVVKSILDRASIETLARKEKSDEISLGSWLMKATQTPKHDEKSSHTSAIAYLDQVSERREILESQFQKALLHAIGTNSADRPKPDQQRPALQIYTCIDDRECSFRRYVEDEVDPNEVETFGIAGFFGLPIRYKPADGRDQMILAPEGQNPTAVLVEEYKDDRAKTRKYHWRQRLFAHTSLAWENASFSPIGSLLLSCLSPISMARLYLVGWLPNMKRKLEEYVQHNILRKPHTDFHLPFPPEQAATLLARSFKDIGTHERFAQLVMVLGHGATSINNPFAAAYNCGACGGHEGGPNARLLARLANDKAVRARLQTDHNICIPDDTVFIGGFHNTTTDTVEFFDVDLVPKSHQAQFTKYQKHIDNALGKNALERCHRFLLAEHVRTTQEALEHVQSRAADPAEVRPELNHATNAAVVIGRRELTKSLFLDRRVFLPSYDPFNDDEIGTNLEHVLAPALIVCSGINLEYLFSTISVDGHGAGTKAPLNIVGNIGVIQGTSGDLRPGLPAQMTEMHIPVRALYVVDAPVERVEAVLSRRPDLHKLVYNDWVHLVVRHPETGIFYTLSPSVSRVPMDGKEKTEYAKFTHHRRHGLNVTHREDYVFWAATAGMLLSCGIPIYMFGPLAMNPYGIPIALCGTLLSLPVLAFSRRYLHGEFMFARFQALCVGLLLGFNLIATAPTLEHAMIGWSLFGFVSTFLIGAYNDRPTVRNNATFAFAAYRVSDFAMLVAATFAHQNQTVAAGALLLAALFKSSQFPLTSLFLRSMEGPTPASALGYAGLSAHVGVVLLAGTMPLWFGFDWARYTIGAVGIFTALHSTLISKVRSDRKGSLARATAATIGLIFVILALGHPELALLISLGHAAFRMTQVLYAPNMLTQAQNLQKAIGRVPWPKLVPSWLYRFVWTLRRVDTDFHLLNILHWMSRRLPMPRVHSKLGQWLVTSVCIVLAGAPFTPVSHYMDEWLTEVLPTHPILAGLAMLGHFAVSVVLIRFVLLNVLHRRRFSKAIAPPQTQNQKSISN